MAWEKVFMAPFPCVILAIWTKAINLRLVRPNHKFPVIQSPVYMRQCPQKTSLDILLAQEWFLRFKKRAKSRFSECPTHCCRTHTNSKAASQRFCISTAFSLPPVVMLRTQKASSREVNFGGRPVFATLRSGPSFLATLSTVDEPTPVLRATARMRKTIC